MRGLILAVIVLLVVAACGDGGAPDSTPTPSATPSPTATPTPSPTPTPIASPEPVIQGTGAPGGCLGYPANPYEVAVNLGEPTRYARGIHTIDTDGGDPTLLVDRTGSAVGGPFSGAARRTYSASADGQRIAFLADGYGETVYLLGRSVAGPPSRLTSASGFYGPVLSPDGTLLALSGEGLYVVPTDGGETTRWSSFSWAGSLDWAPDGSSVALIAQVEPSERPGVYVTDVGAEQADRLADGDAVSWSPDGSRIAFAVASGAGSEKGVYVADLDGNVARLSKTVPSTWTTLSWSPDGRCIAFNGVGELWKDLPTRVLDVESGWEVFLTDGTDPTWSPDGSRIAFIRDGNLWTMNVDGSEQTKLTNPRQAFVQEPFWLPDGSGLLFAYAPPLAGSIYLIDPDTGHEVNLADGSGPVWSPDGQRIAFKGDIGGGGLGGWGAIYVMDSEGRNAVKVGEYKWNDLPPMCPMAMSWSWSPDGQLILYSDMVAKEVIVARSDAGGTEKIADGYGPAWSPDGQRFVYSAYGDGAGCLIYLSDLQGIDEADWIAKGTYPIWSPDGQRIAFIRPEPGAPGAGTVYVMNVDGSGERKLMDISRYGSLLPRAWSPDASRLAVAADGLFVVDLATGESQKLADEAYHATWSPDGKQIAYMVGPDHPSSIFVVNADGSSQPRKLTDGSSPAWSPDGSRIAFTR